MSIYQCITKSFKAKNDTLTLFFQKNIYGQEISILSSKRLRVYTIVLIE